MNPTTSWSSVNGTIIESVGWPLFRSCREDCIALTRADKSVSGYAATDYPISLSLSGDSTGVLPPSSMLASFGPSTSAQYRIISSSDWGASRKVQSALRKRSCLSWWKIKIQVQVICNYYPSLRNILHRSMASSNPNDALESVRARITISEPSLRASTAA